MGCDIHLHTEIKINGQWENYGTPQVARDYGLFAVMAGVRNRDNIRPIIMPKGLPKDCSVVTAFNAEHWGPDGHDHSWFDAEQILKLEHWHERKHPDAWPEREWGYLFGNSWGSFILYPDDRPKGLEDIRFVFWFDN